MASTGDLETQMHAASDSSDTRQSFQNDLGSTKKEQNLIDWALPTLDAANLQSKLNSHERFEVKSGYVISGLPKFHDLTQYGMSADHEYQVWEKEVARLVNAANSPKSVQLSGKDDWFGKADGDGYLKLHKIALQLQDALDICIHDNELLLVEHMPAQADKQSYSSARSRLLRVYDPDTAQERYHRHLRLSNNNDRYYHSLVNYITAMMLQVMLRTMRGALWEEHCVITVAKISAKLKAVLSNLPKSASICLSRKEEVRSRTDHQARVQKWIRHEDDPIDTQKNDWSSWQPGGLDAEMRYFVVTKTFNLGISHLLLSALSSLSSNEDTEMSADLFETGVLMYEDYITNRRRFLCSQRNGTIGASSNQRVIDSAGAAFKVCLDVWESLRSQAPADTDGFQDLLDKHNDPWTMLSWEWTELDPDTSDPQSTHIAKSTNFRFMKDFISAFVPYSMVCGSFPSLLQDLSNNVSLIADPTAPVKLVRLNPFLASFSVRTSAYMTRRMYIFKDGACDISQSSLAREKALARSPTNSLLSKYGDEKQRFTHRDLRELRETQRKKIHKAIKESQRWIIDETTIVIPNKLYAWGALSIGVILVLGGLAMGLSLGNRIQGVDPLGFATFSWVLAAFIILVAKSLRVENWPWSRFIRGQVVCRSVNEVYTVTGMDPQTILAILLRLEPRMNLIKRGPFNAVFAKRGADGFAIDVPFRTSTLMDGGLILVQVQSLVGDALVGIMSDLWKNYDFVTPKGDNAGEDRVVCRDFLERGSWIATSPLYSLSRHNVKWFRVVGLFETDVSFY